MSYRAWAYIWGILIAGAALFGVSFTSFNAPATDWLTFAALAILATLAQLFKAEGPNHQAYYATPVFLFAGVLLLQPLHFILLVLIPHLVQWSRERFANTTLVLAWYLQPFNAAMYTIATSTAYWVYAALHTSAELVMIPSSIVALLIAAVTYLSVNQAILGLALVLARGMTWRESGVMDGENLLPEFIMLCLGMVVAVLWELTPWLVLPALSPLVLMFRSLAIPQLKQEAQIDGKTGLSNARHFNKLFGEELERAQRFNRPLAVVMADLDFLRDINNTYGHLAGDAVLQQIGQILRKSVREYDVAGRFGGEEFALVLPETEPVEAQLLAERIRQAIESAPFVVPTSPTPVRVTMSFGVACFAYDATTLTELIHQADIAVYQAKLQGRNRVVCAADVPHSVKLEHQAKAPPQPVVPPNAASSVGNVIHSAEPSASSTTPVSDQAEVGSTAQAQPPRSSESQSHPKQPHTTPRTHTQDQAPVPTTGIYRVLLQAFVVLVVAAGLGVALIGFRTNNVIQPSILAMLIVFAVAAELLQTNVYNSSTVSSSVAIVFAAALINDIPGIVYVASAIALVHLVRRRLPLYKTLFNWATYVLYATMPLLAINMQGIALRIPNLPLLVVLATIASIAAYFINIGLITIAISLSTGAKVIITWREQFRWWLGYYVVLGIIGMFLGVAYTEMGAWGLIVFAAPVLMMHYAQKQYVLRTNQNMRELKRMNTELAQANREVVGAHQAIEQFNADLRHLNDELFLTLGKILDARDPFVSGHAAKVADYATAIANELGLPPERVDAIRRAGFLHDIGKIAISEQVLYKPSKLTDEEYQYMKTHAAVGGELLATSQGLRHLAPFVRHHHERWDGHGYPDGLAGEEIPLEARILNICDSIEAMASDRPYHRGLPFTDIVAELKRCAGTQFDPELVQIFLRVAEREGTQLVVNTAHMVEHNRVEYWRTLWAAQKPSGLLADPRDQLPILVS